MRRIPTTIVTGFLGAGKTSLVRHLLANAAGHRLAIIVNEFGELGIDRELLLGCGDAACRDGDIVELANGCLCCTVADDFLPTLSRLVDRAEPPGHIVVETSGLALPKPLVQAFAWPEIRTRLTVDGVVTVIDAAAAAEDDLAARPSCHDLDAEHDHDDFDSFVVERGPVADGALFRTRLAALIRAHDVLRVKGFLEVPGRDRRQVVQAVGERIEQHFDRAWLPGESRASRLVVIGRKGIDRAAIRAALGAV